MKVFSYNRKGDVIGTMILNDTCPFPDCGIELDPDDCYLSHDYKDGGKACCSIDHTIGVQPFEPGDVVCGDPDLDRY